MLSSLVLPNYLLFRSSAHTPYPKVQAGMKYIDKGTFFLYGAYAILDYHTPLQTDEKNCERREAYRKYVKTASRLQRIYLRSMASLHLQILLYVCRGTIWDVDIQSISIHKEGKKVWK